MTIDYQNTKIYKIESNLGDKIYIGSTTKEFLSQRMVLHRSDYKRWKAGLCGKVMSYDLFDEYGIENCKIVLIESFPCKSKDEKNAREGFHIKNTICVNRMIAGRTFKDRYEENKGEFIARSKVWAEANKEKVNGYKAEYYERNKEKIKERQASQVYECECGLNIRRRHKQEHFRSQKHKLFVEKKKD